MYPVGQAAQKDTPDGWRGERFYFLLQEEICKGFEEAQEWSVQEWLDDQGVEMLGIEAGGSGIETGRHAARFAPPAATPTRKVKLAI